MNVNPTALAQQIGSLPPDWHGAGTMSLQVLLAMAKYAQLIGPINRSAETGAGKTTLLFSHLSANHTAFTLNVGDSMLKVTTSPLFRPGSVTFVDGPTQITIPQMQFRDPLDMVLIDGPHGYPFPDLEYYYFYPHIRAGGLLLIDDINIPTIGRMFDILKQDDMFELLEVVEYTAILRRTTAPTLNPLGDDWWLQGYNRAHYEHLMARTNSGPVGRFLSRALPPGLKRLFPRSLKVKLLKKL